MTSCGEDCGESSGKDVDCSQPPYFSVGFSRPVGFDGTAAIFVYISERDLGRVSKLPRGAGVGVSMVGEGKRKNRGTPLEHETVRSCYSLPIFPAASQLRSPPLGSLDTLPRSRSLIPKRTGLENPTEK